MKHVRDMKGRRLSLPGNVDDVAQQLEQIWQEIPQVTIRELYHSIPCRVAGYIQATGRENKQACYSSDHIVAPSRRLWPNASLV
ncbi:uncharacterized protein TNCV_4543141 [Trichonephila clavipes]|nr:uncharacterized protein TNCV_4543141 [Trichonephila clavipes]